MSSTRALTITVSGNTPHCGDHAFPPHVTLGDVFDRIGSAPREQFRASKVLVVRRRSDDGKPRSVSYDITANEGWRQLTMCDGDWLIYQYDLDEPG